MTDPANLLSRLRADRAGAIEARRYLLAPHLIAADTAPWTRLANPEDGGAAPGDLSDLEAASDEIAGRATGAEGARGAAQRYDAKGFDEDEITLLRSIRAKADRVEERLESFQAWMAETRRLSQAAKSQKPLPPAPSARTLARMVEEPATFTLLG